MVILQRNLLLNLEEYLFLLDFQNPFLAFPLLPILPAAPLGILAAPLESHLAVPLGIPAAPLEILAAPLGILSALLEILAALLNVDKWEGFVRKFSPL